MKVQVGWRAIYLYEGGAIYGVRDLKTKSRSAVQESAYLSGQIAPYWTLEKQRMDLSGIKITREQVMKNRGVCQDDHSIQPTCSHLHMYKRLRGVFSDNTVWKTTTM